MALGNDSLSTWLGYIWGKGVGEERTMNRRLLQRGLHPVSRKQLPSHLLIELFSKLESIKERVPQIKLKKKTQRQVISGQQNT